MNKISISFCLLLSLVSLVAVDAAAQQLSLAGEWRFMTDPNDAGIKESWFKNTLTDRIQLPGSMAQHGKGNDITLTTKWTGSIYDSSWFFQPRLAKYRTPGNIKIPFWLTPAKHYVGVAWYQKDVTIPAAWSTQRIRLFLERVHTISMVWIDGLPAGSQNSLSTAHQYELTKLLSPGRHVITVRIDNRIKDMNVGPDSHSVTDHTQGNWNGITGSMFLEAGSQVSMKDVQVFPDVANKKAQVELVLSASGEAAEEAVITFNIGSGNTARKHVVTPIIKKISVKGDSTLIAVEVLLGDGMLTWDEFNPAIYKLQVTVTDSKGQKQVKNTSFGMRAMGIKGTHITVNDRAVFLRGTVNNCEFPLTGYPPTDTAAWRRLFTIAKAHGLNHMRFHSWCPPLAAFAAADELGFYLQPEVATWPNHGTSLGDGRFIDQYIYDESNRMVKEYGNHPSFSMLAAGNEPAGRNQADYLTRFIKYWRAKDNRRVYTGASVAMSWPLVPENDYMIKSGSRGLGWDKVPPEDTSDYHTAIEKFAMPYITHEMGQWCVYPDFKEISKYKGVYRAKNFELFREDLNDQGMGDQAEAFFKASGKLQALCYKYEIEKSLRTPGLGGFQLLGLQDFPGQGTALVGVLDAFWDSKGYITDAEFKQFCNATVPLIRTEKFVYTNAETLKAAVELYHYGEKDLDNAVVSWQLEDGARKVWAKGSFPAKKISTGANTAIGNLQVALSTVKKPGRFRLSVSVNNTSYSNNWNIWVYPAQPPAIIARQPVHYCDVLDAKAEEVLNSGGTVFLYAAGKVVKGKEVAQHFAPVFWNTSWFKMRPPHTLGFICDSTHPAFAAFPTSNHSDLQWWDIVNRAQVMHLEDFPKGFKPIVQPIDTWFMNRRLALLFEAKVGKGKLIVCSADLTNNLDKRPAARQLLYSLQQYMQSPAFKPASAVELSVVRDLFQTPSRLVFNAFTKDSPDELKPKPAGL